MLQIKVGYSKIDDPKKGGFSFDNYVFHKLVEYGLTPTRACCGDQHLMIKKGIITKTEYNNPNQVLYNFEKWLRRSFIQLGILTEPQVEALCCPTKKTVFIQSNALYFGKSKDLLNMDLKKRLKKLLTDWNVTYTDPCCP